MVNKRNSETNERTHELEGTTNIEEKVWRRKVILAAIIFLLIFIAVIFAAEIYTPPLKLKDVFIDVNGDGYVDLVKSARVILNTNASLNFP